MKVPVFTTVGELVAILFDETRRLGLKTRERHLLVAYLLNDLLRRSSLSRATARMDKLFLPAVLSQRGHGA
jgi:hypothetical protein